MGKVWYNSIIFRAKDRITKIIKTKGDKMVYYNSDTRELYGELYHFKTMQIKNEKSSFDFLF